MARVWIVADFKINQDYIAKVLCINKDEPIKKCNGKCHLKKQLNKVNTADEKNIPANRSNKLDFQTLFVQVNIKLKMPLGIHLNKIDRSKAVLLSYNQHLNQIFRPPKLIII